MMKHSDTYYNQMYLLLNYKTLQEKSLGRRVIKVFEHLFMSTTIH